ncbi:MAG: 50S ribosomal protein L11 methyltransferase [Luteibaculum sp.]
MNYVTWEIHLQSTEDLQLCYPVLSDLGFDSFTEEGTTLFAYITEDAYHGELEKEFKTHPWLANKEIVLQEKKIKGENWNESWEKNFQPISIEDQLHIRAPFHSKSNDFDLEIIIEPQMSFGTGHHETTFLMCQQLLHTDLKGKSVLDMGCGTGILALLAEKRGAKHIVGVEIEGTAVENARHNAQLNDCHKSVFIHGVAEDIPKNAFDVIVANINRNVLKEDLPKYNGALAKGGILMLSGFYTSDNSLLISAAEQEKLILENKNSKNDWSILQFRKA